MKVKLVGLHNSCIMFRLHTYLLWLSGLCNKGFSHLFLFPTVTGESRNKPADITSVEVTN